jgi:hypothetical protein
MAQVHTRLVAALDREISMVELFTYPTVSALGRHLADGSLDAQSFTKVRERAMRQKEHQKAAAKRLHRAARKEVNEDE